MTTITKYKLFWAWPDEKEEDWLSTMALDGWHLATFGIPGIYTFESGPPRKDHYRLDFIIDRKNYREYLQLFKDAGWEHLGEMGGWQYFRKNAEGSKVSEIYTDNKSKSQKYQRLLTFLIILLPIYIMLTSNRIFSNDETLNIYSIGRLFLSLFLIIYIYAVIMIFKRVWQLKGKKRMGNATDGCLIL